MNMINDKPKVFVRYPPGSSGNFICLLLLALTDPGIKIDQSDRVHDNRNRFDQTHNFSTSQNSLSAIKETKSYTNLHSDLASGIAWAKRRFSFYPTVDPYYVISTHVINPAAFLAAFENTKLLTILVTESDLSVVARLWAKKNVINDKKYYWLSELGLPGSASVTEIAQAFKLKYYPTYLDFTAATPKSVPGRIHSIQFSDIITGNLTGQINDLAELLGVTVESTCYSNAKSLIINYAEANRLLTSNSI